MSRLNTGGECHTLKGTLLENATLSKAHTLLHTLCYTLSVTHSLLHNLFSCAALSAATLSAATLSCSVLLWYALFPTLCYTLSVAHSLLWYTPRYTLPLNCLFPILSRHPSGRVCRSPPASIRDHRGGRAHWGGRWPLQILSSQGPAWHVWLWWRQRKMLPLYRKYLQTLSSPAPAQLIWL